MSYSHPELYRMVHKGIDLTGAMEVSAQWARLGTELGEIGDELAKIVDATAAAWQGAAADLARDTLAALTHWAADTGTQATEVSGCVTIEVDNARNARDEMPAPPYPIIDLPTPELPTPMPRPGPEFLPRSEWPTNTIPASAGAFTTTDFAEAKQITNDMAVPHDRERVLHEQAARTLERFQTRSREVYGTVPQFSPPQVGERLYTGPNEPPQPQPKPPPQPPVPVPPGTPGPPGRGGGGGGGGYSSGGSGGTGVRAGSPTVAPAPGTGVGAGESGGQNRPAAAASANPGRGGGGGPMGMGGMPMGAAGAGRGDDVERKVSPYVKEDEDIWGMNDGRTVPPVLGEENRRA
jgi:hypothetical protein